MNPQGLNSSPIWPSESLRGLAHTSFICFRPLVGACQIKKVLTDFLSPNKTEREVTWGGSWPLDTVFPFAKREPSDE